MPPHYSELFCQSNFSFLEGASHADELVIQAAFLGYQAIAICDECSVAGVVKAHTAIKEHQLSIKLIVGSLFRLNQDMELLLLCPHRQAYAELCRLITKARRRAKKGTYQLNEWDITSLQHCLIIWLPSGKEHDQASAKWLKKHHHNRLWIGLQRHLKFNDRQYGRHCRALAKAWHLPITACGGVLMHTATRLPLQHALTAIKKGLTIPETGKHLLYNTERCLRSRQKLSKLFCAEHLNESLVIAQLCQFKLDELRYEYPSELVPKGQTAITYLRQLVQEGIKARFPEGLSTDIEDTIDKELKLIEELDYPYFFLTIHDIVMFAKQRGILYQGRGSAANSIVCYCLEITSVDPRQISVLFERFISKERNEPPDIDVDFEHERREEVIQYIYQKYGRERAALAASVITYRFKSAVRDVGKALGITDTQLDFFIKNVNRRDSSLSWQSQIVELGLNPETGKGQQFINLVDEIMGFPRHLSQHVGGFVISSGPLYELVPVENASMDDRTIIQWDKDDLESLGLLKVDVLALGMLSAIRKAFTLIKHYHQKDLSIAGITRLQDDPEVYQMIQRADTVGVFQIESRAQMSMLPRLKPNNYYDLVIQIAIVRPGPIQGDMVHPFLKRRNGEEATEYPSEAVKEVLSRTLGVPIFQEQVIKLAMVAAGFTGGEADQLRRAMASWKKSGKLMQFRTKLIEGMLERGYEQAFAERIFEQICGFGEYGFPESHSASFAVLAYASAWLKYHYPVEFYTALLNSLPMGFYSVSQLVQDAQRHGLEILPVCINQSNYDHRLEARHTNHSPSPVYAMRLGLRLVNNLSKKGAQELITKRPDAGYQNARMLNALSLRQQDLEALASAKALQCFADNRYAARWALMDKPADLELDIAPADTASSKPIAENIEHLLPPSDIDDLIEDYASVQLSLEQHPISLLAQSGCLGKFTRANQLSRIKHQSFVDIAGVVTGKQSPGTASGVTFMTLEDDTGNINVIIWAGTARAQKKAYLSAKILKIKGILEREGDVTHVIAGKLEDMSEQLVGLQSRSRDFH